MSSTEYPVGVSYQGREAKGPGRGWWGPPKGTHGPGSQGGQSKYTDVDMGDYNPAQRDVRFWLSPSESGLGMESQGLQSEKSEKVRARLQELGKQYKDKILKAQQEADEAFDAYDKICRRGMQDTKLGLAAYAAAQKKYKAAIRLMDEARGKAYDIISGRKKYEGALDLRIHPYYDTPGAKASIHAGADWLEGMMQRSMKHPKVTVVPIKGRSGYYAKEQTVGIGLGESSNAVVHELGHWMEHENSSARREAEDFLSRRTKGTRTICLARYADGYGLDEYARPDKFVHPYIGKLYPDGTTEVVSMGVEMMYVDPIGFAIRDPDHFEFTYDVLRGGRGRDIGWTKKLPGM